MRKREVIEPRNYCDSQWTFYSYSWTSKFQDRFSEGEELGGVWEPGAQGEIW